LPKSQFIIDAARKRKNTETRFLPVKLDCAILWFAHVNAKEEKNMREKKEKMNINSHKNRNEEVEEIGEVKIGVGCKQMFSHIK
jgi:hypothetical protein